MSSLFGVKGSQYALVPVKYFVEFPIWNLSPLTLGNVSAVVELVKAKTSETTEGAKNLIVRRY
jgi:hypothetical protein